MQHGMGRCSTHHRVATLRPESPNRLESQVITRNELFLGGLGDNRVLFAIDVQHGKDIKLYSVYAAPTSGHN